MFKYFKITPFPKLEKRSYLSCSKKLELINE